MMHRNGKSKHKIEPVDLTPLAFTQKTPQPTLNKQRKKLKLEIIADWLLTSFLVSAAIYFLAHLLMWAMRGFKVYGL